jgi:predicted GIY-YIG superfamily endonuclease
MRQRSVIATGTIYLLHFSEAYKHARHYVGFTTNLEQRIEEHGKGQGSRLMQVIAEAGLTFSLARTRQGTRKTERQIKNRKEAPRLCPLCNPHASH